MIATSTAQRLSASGSSPHHAPVARVQLLVLFRTLVGFGIAGAHVAYTLFMEFLAPGHRGVWLTCIEAFWTAGSLFLAGMAWLVLPSSLGWRGLVVIAAVPLALLMALYPFLKESPHWLLASGHPAKAQARPWCICIKLHWHGLQLAHAVPRRAHRCTSTCTAHLAVEATSCLDAGGAGVGRAPEQEVDAGWAAGAPQHHGQQRRPGQQRQSSQCIRRPVYH
jgi:MFS family permease